MQTLLTLILMGFFFGPALVCAGISTVRLNRTLVIRVFVGYFCIFLLLGFCLRLFPSLVDPR